MSKLEMLFCNALPAGLSDDIMYIPEGNHEIECSVDGKAKAITVKMKPERGEAIAAMMNRDLKEKLESNVRPIFDFDHNQKGPAAALPKRFYYEQGRGLMVECEWTGSGKRARKDKDYSYFSPSFSRNSETGEPNGLGEGGPLGALVNDPAFRNIERVAASKADLTKQKTTKKMSNELIQAGILTKVEAGKDDAQTVAAQRVTELREKSDRCDAAEAKVIVLETEAKATKSATADSAVSDAVKAGRIPSKDEATQTFWKNQIIEAGAPAIAALNAIPVIDIESNVVNAGSKKPEGKQQRIDAAQAKARTELGENAKFQPVWNRAQELDPEAFVDSE